MSTPYPLQGPWSFDRRPFDRQQSGRRRGPHPSRTAPVPEPLRQEADGPADEQSRGRGRARGRRHGYGPGDLGPGGFGFGAFGPGGFGPRGPRGPRSRHGGRARRGDVRAAILALLTEEPMHGYQLMQEIAGRSDGVWRPSAGSVYPALALLEDEGLVRPGDDGGRKVFALTDAGRAYVEEHAADLESPWDAVTGGVSDTMAQTMDLLREIGFAAMQVMRSGDQAKAEQARTVLADTRRALYLVLAGEPEAGPEA